MGRFVFEALPNRLMGALLLAGVGINFANVVGRYVFGRAVFWAEEVLVFMTIWGVFLGMIAIAHGGAHLTMDLLSSRLTGRARTVVNGFAAGAIVACSGFVMIQSYRIVVLFAQTGQVSVAAGVPKAIAHAALLVGFALTAIAVLVRLRAYLTGKF